MRCASCGARRRKGSRYCGSCGMGLLDAFSPTGQPARSEGGRIGYAHTGAGYGESAAARGAPVDVLEYRGVGIRFVAWLIDAILILAVFWVFTVTIRGGWGFNLVFYMMWFPYFWLLEAATGQTLGKNLVGIKVVRPDGGPIGYGAALVRNLVRVVDVMPLFIPFLLGAILVWTSAERQRLGDRAAKTIVVSAK